ncbi:Capsanthin/capsorubin synthase, chromoplastic [Sesamum alatum]|uniref:Capsanthin/capsorubin synthase, chromoplastic n=1 Tax=Sesamum alatum TaxID=300844 RepID=A0AAE2CN09_9LAMI|nr:Capsanthin/capsorubin synthase, chromoplastic [Sesamum alatum]
MASLSAPPLLSTSGPCSLPAKARCLHFVDNIRPRKDHQRVQSSKIGSFLDLEPAKSKPESLEFDVPWFDPAADRRRFDVIIIGAGPAGLRLAEQVSSRGIKVCCVDPSPLSMWPNNYGVWVDEFERLGLEDCLDKTWPICSVYINDDNPKYLNRAYGRVGRKELKLRFLSNCAVNGVKFHKAKAWKVEHEAFESSVACDDGAGTELKADLIVDASGFRSSFIEYNKPRTDHGYQIAHEVKQRMAERLRHLGIQVRRVIEEEKCFFQMGGPLPRIPQSIMAFGGNSGLVHSATGYTVARTMALAPAVAEAIAECLGSTCRGSPLLYDRVWNALWPVERRWSREYNNLGMEILLALDLEGTRGFLDAFFKLNPHQWQGFLSSTLSFGELVMMGLSVFGHASNRCRFHMLTKSAAPLLKMFPLLPLHPRHLSSPKFTLPSHRSRASTLAQFPSPRSALPGPLAAHHPSLPFLAQIRASPAVAMLPIHPRPISSPRSTLPLPRLYHLPFPRRQAYVYIV